MTWKEGKRIDAVTTWLITGNMVITAGVTGIPEMTLRAWKREPWWHELVSQIQTESDLALDAKLSKRIEKALDIVNDRLDHGDYQYDPKTGQFVRKPVSVKDGWKVANEMIDKRWILRKQPHEAVSQEAVGDILRNLAKEFAEMAKKRVREATHDLLPMKEVENAKTENPVQNETASQETRKILDNGPE